jgi:hypothetical protein
MSWATAFGTGFSKSEYDVACRLVADAGEVALAEPIDTRAAAAPSRPAIFLSIFYPPNDSESSHQWSLLSPHHQLRLAARVPVAAIVQTALKTEGNPGQPPKMLLEKIRINGLGSKHLGEERAEAICCLVAKPD